MKSYTGFDSIHYEAGEAVAADANEIWICDATAAVTKGQFVEITAPRKVKPATATLTGMVGIALTSAAANGIARVLIGGYGTVTADATGVQAGAYVKPDASGKATVGSRSGFVGICANNSGANGVAVVKLD